MTPYMRGLTKLFSSFRRSFENEFKEAVGKYAESLVETVYCFQEMDQLPGNLAPDPAGKTLGNGSRHLGRKRPYTRTVYRNQC